MKEQLLEIAQKYSLEEIKAQIEALEENITVSIGFLGEFNSGKSTLINALLGQKLLPAMEKPTTKSIIEIIPVSGLEKKEFYEKVGDNELKSISPLEFSEIALGRRPGKAVIKVPASDILKEGYLIIDTPGIHSLDNTDVDITYGYLPFLDGAIICQDINYGSFTESVLKFLSLPEIKPIINNFIFTLTKADTKSEEAIEKIRQEVINLLIKISQDMGLNLENIQEKVVVVSGLKALKENNFSHIKELSQAFNSVILAKKELMLKYRKEKILKDLANETIKILSYIKENLNYSDEEIKNKEIEIREEINRLKEEKEEFRRKLQKLEERLCDSFQRIVERISPGFETIKTEEDAERLINEFVFEIHQTTKKKIKRFLEDFTIPNLGYIADSLKSSIIKRLKTIELAESILFGILVAVIGPAAGAENIAEGALGTMVSEVVSASISKERKQSKSEETNKKVKVKNLLGSILKNINPIKYIGDLVKPYFIKGTANQLSGIAADTCTNIVYELQEEIEEIVFYRLEKELKNKEKALMSIRKEREKKIKEVHTQKEDIEKDIKKLESLIEN